MEETGVLERFIWFSKSLSEMEEVNSGENWTRRFLLVMRIWQKPKGSEMSLSYLVKSTKARKRVFMASRTTSLPRRQAEAMGTGLQ